MQQIIQIKDLVKYCHKNLNGYFIFPILRNSFQLQQFEQILQNIQSQKMLQPIQENIRSEMQRIEQILTYAKTFRMHPLIMLGKIQVSPYDLACNGFVNKNFKEEQRQRLSQKQQKLSFNQKLMPNPLSQITCCCRVPDCMKIIKFNSVQNQKYDEITRQDQVQLILTDHQQNCTFYKQNYNKLTVSQLFNVSNLFYDKIYETYTKDSHSMIGDLTIDWNLADKLIFSSVKSQKSNINLECYKKIDKNLSTLNKRLTKSILLSIFGWCFVSAKQNITVVLKCNFCGIKKQVHLNQSKFDFYQSHNSWCLILNKKYEIWKLALKKKYIQFENETLKSDQMRKKLLHYVIPKDQIQIESKQLRYQVYESAKPTLQKIDELLQFSLQMTRKQIKIDQQFEEKHLLTRNEQKKKDHIEKFSSLDQISRKCQDLIKNFINSIEVNRV